MRKLFLTVFYTGLSPKAPGTVGSLLALILGLALLTFMSVSNLFMLSVLITVIAVKQIDAYEKEVGEHDSKEIVIDELVGMWIALSVCNITMDNMLYMAPLAFIYFRLFDIWKPSIIGKIDEKIEGGWGVMGDDIIAGIAAGVATAGTYQLLVKFIL
ncbi:phosphatidylglycerophosphatase A [Candidatus Marinarcus aquaticus]|uniref:Phosphatidylglycerophosphatase A n=1 Tax=Candidatus Marinarcus aquaticus TaxID=2044504 RepID=A0A4Q0XSA0_9BACT|nr:phosphatidylglycerophosphatase A [Candidatus Marinarcus aquaticus]RXJ57947.1 phosphatidylglycerophosphatase A [Candidatus Marinarcus aquaticus]